MAILGNFEITVLTPTTAVSKITGLVERQWKPLTEYTAPRSDKSSATNCQKYVGLPTPRLLPSRVDSPLMQYCPYTNTYTEGANPSISDDAVLPPPQEELLEFAIDYKVHCGFSFVDADDASLIIFRTYLDGERIGSGLVKRERWERSGSYRVRKHGKRVWDGNAWYGQWVKQKWAFEPGRHGTITIEAWRETENEMPSRRGPFDIPNFTNTPFGNDTYNDGRLMIDLTTTGDSSSPVENVAKIPRVKRTRKVDMWPMATFVFDYRTEDTLQILGMMEGHSLDDEVEDFHEQQRETSAATVIEVEQKQKQRPLQPLRAKQQSASVNIDASHFWDTLDRSAQEEVPLVQSDTDFSTILRHMEVEYEHFTAREGNDENMVIPRDEVITITEDGADEFATEAMMSGEEAVDLGWAAGQHIFDTNGVLQDHNIEVVDLTMLD